MPNWEEKNLSLPSPSFVGGPLLLSSVRYAPPWGQHTWEKKERKEKEEECPVFSPFPFHRTAHNILGPRRGEAKVLFFFPSPLAKRYLQAGRRRFHISSSKRMRLTVMTEAEEEEESGRGVPPLLLFLSLFLLANFDSVTAGMAREGEGEREKRRGRRDSTRRTECDSTT